MERDRPMRFPILPPLEHFDSEQLKRDLNHKINRDLERQLVILDPRFQVESMLSKAITTACDLVPLNWRDLMLLC